MSSFRSEGLGYCHHAAGVAIQPILAISAIAVVRRHATHNVSWHVCVPAQAGASY
jgi:hypothetical protein